MKESIQADQAPADLPDDLKLLLQVSIHDSSYPQHEHSPAACDIQAPFTVELYRSLEFAILFQTLPYAASMALALRR